MAQEDSLAKFLKISAMLLVLLILFIALIAGVMVGLRAFFGLFGDMPVVALIYKVAILSIPAAVFISAFSIFVGYTRRHPSKTTRMISFSLILFTIISWSVVYIIDLYGLSKLQANTVENYYSFNTFFLAANVLLLILIGILQAFTAPKEKDWMERG